ncbi:uncharacterized protein F5891DRAFT_1030293 [Suillus fuscotomentosus]|uniref:Uncharacterized protein n=1 Tax=Suillus fuscotomentosus TaxID=1912939 RepID=A0AAD4E8B1_9AGAM|nr:uncharacterized protein F5891DRAFT_1030293 [Suillus fuscotomentosus]KAG1901171.1 hypothetical protein F5891DRAFT_1030293 [Suillus fuscotomentosus]
MIHHIRKQTCFVLLSQVLGAQDLPLRSRLAREKSEKKCRSERQRSFDVAKLVGFQGSVNASSGCAADSLSSALPSEAFIPCRSGAKDPDEFLRVVASRTSSVLMRLPTCGVVIALRLIRFDCFWGGESIYVTGWMTRAPTNSHDVDGVPASAREPTVFVIDKGNATAHEYMNEWRLPINRSCLPRREKLTGTRLIQAEVHIGRIAPP